MTRILKVCSFEANLSTNLTKYISTILEMTPIIRELYLVVVILKANLQIIWQRYVVYCLLPSKTEIGVGILG